MRFFYILVIKAITTCPRTCGTVGGGAWKGRLLVTGWGKIDEFSQNKEWKINQCLSKCDYSRVYPTSISNPGGG